MKNRQAWLNQALFFFFNVFVQSNLITGSFINAEKPKAIIISFNALFRPDEKKMEEHIRHTIGLWQGFKLWAFEKIPDPVQARDEFFSTFKNIPLLQNLSVNPKEWQTQHVLWDRDYPFPPILCQYHTSATAADEAKICQHIKKYLHNNKNIKKAHAYMLQGISDHLFQAKYMNPVLKSSTPLVHALKTIKKNGTNLILTAGINDYAWNKFLIEQQQADIIHELFNIKQCYISGKIHALPTSPACLQIIIKDHHLKPHECLVIANHQRDLDYAHSIGMRTIVFDEEKDKQAKNNRDIFYNEFKMDIG